MFVFLAKEKLKKWQNEDKGKSKEKHKKARGKRKESKCPKANGKFD